MQKKYFINKLLKKNSSFILLINLYNHLSKRRKKQLNLLFLLNIITGLSESFSLGALYPFLGILLSPDKINDILPSFITNVLPNDNTEFVIIFVTLLFIISSIFSSFLRLFSLWVNGRFSASLGNDFGHKAFTKILKSPYQSHLIMDSNKNLATLTVHLNSTVIAIDQFLRLLTFAVISILIILFLFLFNFSAAFVATFVITLSYLLLINITKENLITNSDKIAKLTKNELGILRESFVYIKDIILDYSQKRYLSKYKKIDLSMRRMQAQNTFLGLSPRYILESLGIVFIASFALYLSLNSDQSFFIIPILGTIALGAQKLLPSMQQVYRAWALIKAYNSDIKNVLELLEIPDSLSFLPDSNFNKKDYSIFGNSLRFENVSFSYKDGKDYVLKDLNFTIFKGEKIGIIGTTGSGKSTLLDLILSLLEPTKGKIYIDDIEISKNNIFKWRTNIAHVPQSIFLLDDTISANISLSDNKDRIDNLRLIDAARKSQILDLCNKLEKKFDTQVGENGINLSGGQRQRIGIARALYKNANVIIFDEATSALDIKTEKLVMDSIDQINRENTVIMVTHRLSSLTNFDRIIKLEEGKLVKFDSPNKILDGF